MDSSARISKYLEGFISASYAVALMLDPSPEKSSEESNPTFA